MIVSLTKDEARIVARAQTLTAEHVAPNAAAWEARRTTPRDALRQGCALGLAGLLIPKRHGGLELRHVAAAKVMETLATACPSFAFALWVHHNATNGIARSGSDAQIDKYVPAMLAGDLIGAFCLTEPGTGSDAAAITTQATPNAGGWTINGTKSWVTNGAWADVHAVYCQTDAANGWRGIASFIVDGTAQGLARTPAYDLLGGHAMGSAGLTFANCHVPADSMLLPPGQGFKAAMGGINQARVFASALLVGALRAALDYAVAFARQRNAFGKPVLEFQGLQWQLADVATDLEAARLLTYAAAAALDRGETAMLEAAHAKKFTGRAALAGIVQCMQAMGAEGLKCEHPLARHLSFAKAAQYLDGTTEIQNVVIGRSLLASAVIKDKREAS